MLPVDLLPDGTSFAFWDCETEFTRTYYVNQAHPAASDSNPGIEDKPFQSIQRAAGLVQPGERVLISPGVYRECVRPARGGDSPQCMISFESTGEGEVIISGAEIWHTEWVRSRGWKRAEEGDQPTEDSACVWVGTLPGEVFGGYNPFGTSNASHMPFGTKYFYEGMPKGVPTGEFMQRRGLFFVDGKLMQQVIFPWDLWQNPGSFWIEDNGLVVHFRLWDDSSPYEHTIEFTAREQCFTPVQPYQGYIRVKGLTFEKVGNGIPQPQRGALSTFCGHHWIIENCTIRWANTIGVDIGQQSHWRYAETLKGFMIFRRNTVTDCGMCGLAAVPSFLLTETKEPGTTFQNRDLLVEDNRFERNCWHNVEHHFESGAMKLHFTQDSLIRGNILLDTYYGPAIWTDFGNINTRITSNAIIGVQSAMFGGIFVEASQEPVLVDNNLVYQVGANSYGTDGGGHGIYEHDCDYLRVENNLVCGAEGAAIYLHLGDKNRNVFYRGSTGRKMRVLGNILNDCGLAIVIPNPDNQSEGNLFGSFRKFAPWRIQNTDEYLNLRAWREFFGLDIDALEMNITVHWDISRLCLEVTLGSPKGQISEAIYLLNGWDLSKLITKFTSSI